MSLLWKAVHVTRPGSALPSPLEAALGPPLPSPRPTGQEEAEDEVESRGAEKLCRGADGSITVVGAVSLLSARPAPTGTHS